MYVLGISCYYHDAAACLLSGETVVAAAAEERFSREKHDSSFPSGAVEYCLETAGISIDDIDYVGFYEKPITKFDRILETHLSIAPRGFRSYMASMPLWVRKRLWVRGDLREQLGYEGPILFGGHHESHAASAFYASPFEEAAFLTVDGVGEWNTTTWGVGRDNTVDIRGTIDFPHSLGLLYSAFTSYLGFEVNNGEYKVMGLSSYGEPRFADRIREELLDIADDGSFHLNTSYFEFIGGLSMVDDSFESLFGYPQRDPDGDLADHHFDLAASIQSVTEELVLGLTENLYERTEQDTLVMAGGVALNSVANGRLLTESRFEDVFVQPAAGDDGGAYGVAASIYYEALDNDRSIPADRVERMNGTYLGPSYTEAKIIDAVETGGVETTFFDDEADMWGETARRLASKEVVGCYQGRMEWGPRALGNRSILADPRDGDMQDVVNRKIKFREGFRPFAPSVLADHATEYFEAPRQSPYMLFVFDVKPEKREEIPAVTHVDGTSRIQTVAERDNSSYYKCIDAFRAETGTPVVLNTSLNMRGQPIVNTPEQAVDVFQRTDMDAMVFSDAACLIYE